MTRQSIRILTGEDVIAALSLREAITVVRDAFVQLSSGEASVPVRTRVDMPHDHAGALLMPVYLPAAGYVGAKFVTLHDRNLQRSLPRIHGVVLLASAETGRPLALIDGEALTLLRTAAATGLATDLLSNRSARVAAVIGAGAQGRWQIPAVHAVRPIERAYVLNRDSQRASALATELRQNLGIDAQVAPSTDVLHDADIICAATSSSTPVFEHRSIRAGAHINGIGSYRPDMAEVPAETVKAAKVVVDHRPSCLAEAGDLVQPIRSRVFSEAHIHAEIGEVASGQKAGRESASEITFFKSVGNAVQDLAAAGRIYEIAVERDLGSCVPL